MDDGRGPDPRSFDEAAIRALEAAYDTAWNAADLQALTAPFTPDATIVLVRGDGGWRIAQVRAYVHMDGPRP
jgi:uncharacterized protein (TIGR02246 family)